MPASEHRRSSHTDKYVDVIQCMIIAPNKTLFFSASPEVIKLFSCSAQLSMKFSLLMNMKMPIFIFISRGIFILARKNSHLLII